MLLGERFKEFSHWPAFAPFGLFESAADAPDALQQLVVVEKLLICFSALDDNPSLAVDGEDGRLPRLLQPPDVLFGVPLEVAQGMSVGKVKVHA